MVDAGHDVPRLAFLLADLPVEVLGWMRSDRVMRRATPPRVYNFEGGRPPKHGGEFVFGDSATWGESHAATVTATTRYGTAQAVDDGEPPHACAVREVAEELGLDIPCGDLLVVDWAPPQGDRPRPMMNFIFDGGIIDDPSRIRLQTDELDDAQFLPWDEAATKLPATTAARTSPRREPHPPPRAHPTGLDRAAARGGAHR